MKAPGAAPRPAVAAIGEEQLAMTREPVRVGGAVVGSAVAQAATSLALVPVPAGVAVVQVVMSLRSATVRAEHLRVAAQAG